MYKLTTRASCAIAGTIALACTSALAEPVPLSSYANEKGFIDVQTLTCLQLANTFQEDADLLTAWYSGWYNGLARKHAVNPVRGRDLEHQLIVYCKNNPGKKVIEGLAVVFNDKRIALGIRMK